MPSVWRVPVTVVAAISTPFGSAIGSDSMAASGDLCAPSASPKIGKFGNVLLGFAGSWRAGQQFFEHTSRLYNPTLRQILDCETPETDWNLLVVEGTRIYEVSADKGVVEALNIEGYAYSAIGSGAPVCLGALAYASPKLDRQALKRALYVTAEHTTTVGAPFHVVEL